jgi:hypothetical protein
MITPPIAFAIGILVIVALVGLVVPQLPER